MGAALLSQIAERFPIKLSWYSITAWSLRQISAHPKCVRGLAEVLVMWAPQKAALSANKHSIWCVCVTCAARLSVKGFMLKEKFIFAFVVPRKVEVASGRLKTQRVVHLCNIHCWHLSSLASHTQWMYRRKWWLNDWGFTNFKFQSVSSGNFHQQSNL